MAALEASTLEHESIYYDETKAPMIRRDTHRTTRSHSLHTIVFIHCLPVTSSGNNLYNQANVRIKQITVTNGARADEGLYSTLVTAHTQAVQRRG